MSTPGAWLTLLAVVVAVVGIVLSVRLRLPRFRLLALLATSVATVVVGWFAWYSSIQV